MSSLDDLKDTVEEIYNLKEGDSEEAKIFQKEFENYHAKGKWQKHAHTVRWLSNAEFSDHMSHKPIQNVLHGPAKKILTVFARMIQERPDKKELYVGLYNKRAQAVEKVPEIMEHFEDGDFVSRYHLLNWKIGGKNVFPSNALPDQKQLRTWDFVVFDIEIPRPGKPDFVTSVLCRKAKDETFGILPDWDQLFLFGFYAYFQLHRTSQDACLAFFKEVFYKGSRPMAVAIAMQDSNKLYEDILERLGLPSGPQAPEPASAQPPAPAPAPTHITQNIFVSGPASKNYIKKQWTDANSSVNLDSHARWAFNNLLEEDWTPPESTRAVCRIQELEKTMQEIFDADPTAPGEFLLEVVKEEKLICAMFFCRNDFNDKVVWNGGDDDPAQLELFLLALLKWKGTNAITVEKREADGSKKSAIVQIYSWEHESARDTISHMAEMLANMKRFDTFILQHPLIEDSGDIWHLPLHRENISSLAQFDRVCFSCYSIPGTHQTPIAELSGVLCTLDTCDFNRDMGKHFVAQKVLAKKLTFLHSYPPMKHIIEAAAEGNLHEDGICFKGKKLTKEEGKLLEEFMVDDLDCLFTRDSKSVIP